MADDPGPRPDRGQPDGGDEELPQVVIDLLPAYLARQRWYAGTGPPSAGEFEVIASRRLEESGGAVLHWIVVRADGDQYQLLVGGRPNGTHAGFLNGREDAVIGATSASFYYDATADPDLALEILPVVSGGERRASVVRPISAEQSNTSLVFDDEVIVKVFRRLAAGENPDAQVTTALAEHGFTHVAEPVARWQWHGLDLALAQRFLAGGTDGWALAQTSLRDYYESESDDPAAAGGDFGGESRRLGRVTAELHLALAEVFGAQPAPSEAWSGLVDHVLARLEDHGEMAESLVARLRQVDHPGPVLRVHGDYHLGQVMRTDTGWYVLDFEGEPARPLEQRLAPASPLKDVAGMLRSFDYAAHFALRARLVDERPGPRATAWERHNREAFLAGFNSTSGIQALLPGPAVAGLVLAGYEIDKALYELDYERAYRPTWEDIPLAAIGRILARQRE